MRPISHRLAGQPHLAVVVLAVGAAVLTGAVALTMDLPIRDPDGIAGPAYVRLPLILGLLFALDVVPRAVIAWRRGHAAGLRRALRVVVAERWPRRRLGLAAAGLFSFYLIYIAYRNLKSFLPFVREGTADAWLLELDRAMAFGRDPATLLHDALGTGIAAHVLSVVYVFFLLFVPLSLAAALVWTRDVARGFWYVTAMCVCWLLGALSYYVLPSLGPVFVSPTLFAELPVTGVTDLQAMLWEHRVEVLADPHATAEVHGIAGFASLHVAIVFSAALVGQLVGLRAALRRTLWAFFGLTVLATIYFGWHYLVDDVAGVAIGAIAVWVGALVTGHDPRAALAGRPQLATARTSEWST